MKRYSVNDSCVEDPMVESESGEYIAYSEVAKIKADAIRDAVMYIHNGTGVIKVDDIIEYADKLEAKQ